MDLPTKPPLVFGLPNELLLMISEACLFNTAISLRQSCRTLFNALCNRQARLGPPYCQVDVCFERLCMDDEYKSGRQGRAVCSVCKTCHYSTEFTPRQLERKPTERVCVNAQRLLSLAPDTRYSYQELLQKAMNAYDGRPLNTPYSNVCCSLAFYMEPWQGTKIGGLTLEPRRSHGPDASPWNTGVLRYWMILIQWSIDLRDPTTAHPILTLCPHMTSVHPRITQMIDQLRSEAQDHEQTDEEERTVTYSDENCGTQVAVKRSFDTSMVRMLVLRPLGPLHGSASHPDWIAQSQSPSDAEQDLPAATGADGHSMIASSR